MKKVCLIRQAGNIPALPFFVKNENVIAEIILDGLIPSKKRLFQVLRNTSIGYTVFIDPESANKFPEIVIKQNAVVLLSHESNLDADISSYNQFNESLCINCGAKFWYNDADYKDPNNRKLLNTIDIQKYLFTEKDFDNISENSSFNIEEYLHNEIISEYKKQILL